MTTPRPIYSVQHWVEVDGIHDGWVTGYGHYTTSLTDARNQLQHDQKAHPNVQFRLAAALLTDWMEIN